MLSKLQNRIMSDSAESNTVSIIVWISVTVVLVLTVGTIIYNAVKETGEDIADKIKNSGTIIAGG